MKDVYETIKSFKRKRLCDLKCVSERKKTRED